MGVAGWSGGMCSSGSPAGRCGPGLDRLGRKTSLVTARGLALRGDFQRCTKRRVRMLARSLPRPLLSALLFSRPAPSHSTQHHSRRAHTSLTSTTALRMHMHNPDRASSVLCKRSSIIIHTRVWAPPLRVTSPEAVASRFCAAQRGLGNHGLGAATSHHRCDSDRAGGSLLSAGNCLTRKSNAPRASLPVCAV